MYIKLNLKGRNNELQIIERLPYQIKTKFVEEFLVYMGKSI
jgi:hypothetical protein